MKNLYTIIFSMLLTLYSCNSDDTKKKDNTIIGTWQLIESSILGGKTVQIDNGYLVTFNEDRTFSSICGNTSEVFHEGFVIGVCKNAKGQKTTGGYNIISEDTITLTFNELISGFANEEFAKERNYRYSFNEEYLMLYNPLCDEGCYDKLKLIESE